MDKVAGLLPVTVYGTVFENQDTKEQSLDVGTIRYHLEGSRLAAKQLQGEMHPESRRRMKPVKIMRLRLDKESSNDRDNG